MGGSGDLRCVSALEMAKIDIFNYTISLSALSLSLFMVGSMVANDGNMCH